MNPILETNGLRPARSDQAAVLRRRNRQRVPERAAGIACLRTFSCDRDSLAADTERKDPFAGCVPAFPDRASLEKAPWASERRRHTRSQPSDSRGPPDLL